jgi:kynureninase
MTRDEARALDRADPLARFREQFVLPDRVIYLDGNSLGPLTAASRDASSTARSGNGASG